MQITTDEKHILNLIDIARQGKTVRMIGIGSSMRPLLKDGRDFVDLIAVEDNTILKKNDVIFYKSHEDQYVLHRIYTVTGEGYYPNGDGNLCLEPLLPRDNIYLKAIGFLRNGRYISVQSKLYRLYSSLWTSLRPIRGSLLIWYERICIVLAMFRRNHAHH